MVSPALRTAVAAPNSPAARAGVEVVHQGGNAVDAAIAAMAVTLVTEPGIVSAGAGAFVAIRPAGGEPVVVDGNVEMPGRGLPPARLGGGVRQVWLDYGGGMTIGAGAGSVATPGVFAALETARERHGRSRLPEVLAPAVEIARGGWTLGPAAGGYLQIVGEQLLGFDPETRSRLTVDGVPVGPGATLRDPDLADTLEAIGRGGTAVLYGGELGAAVADHLQSLGGLLTREDLATYTAVVRPATATRVGRWEVATPPPPSIGGPVLATMLRLLGTAAPTPGELARVQRAVLAHRRDRVDAADDLARAGQDLLAQLEQLRAAAVPTSADTAHVSAVDSDGNACAITASAGYGSGVTVPGTGLLLNNSLGEPELNRRGLHALPPGTRLASNMAPTTAVGPGGEVLAVGTPGADRITTALQQVLARFLLGGADLQAAVDAPRLHVRLPDDGEPVVEHEPDPRVEAALTELGWAGQAHPAHAMYFGGVGAALLGPGGELVAAGDPRRSAAVAAG